MRFIVDAQLPPALAKLLIRSGHVAEHVAEIEMGTASDEAIWAFAVEARAAIITKDEDFAQLKALSTGGPSVVWVRIPNTRRHDLLAWFSDVLPGIVAALERGDDLIELV